MKVIKTITASVILSFLISSCSESGSSSPILVFLNPDSPQIEANSGDKVIISIDASTSGSSLDLRIESIDDLYGIVEVLDTTFNRSAFIYRFQYTVPPYPDSTSSLLVFNLVNDLGATSEIAKRIIVNRGETFLTESSGIELFSSASTKANAYSISNSAPGFSTDTVNADIIDLTEEDQETLSRSLGSLTGLSFVEFNGFDYANATSATIKNAFENGVKLAQVSNVTDSDIYLVGKSGEALAAIQIIAVTDQPNIQEDKYTFSIKIID